MYPYFEQQVIDNSSYNSNWLNSFIKPISDSVKISFLDGSMTVFHLH
jgi:hypothetical protein